LHINTVCLRLSETEAFPIQVGVQWVNDKAVQAVVKKKPENVVAVVSGSLKPYLYFALGCGACLDSFQQTAESLHVVGDGEHIGEDFTL
jgi:hypothetical protein